MDRREQRPPRSAPPRGSSVPPSYAVQERPPLQQPGLGSRGNVSFQATERGDRTAPLDESRHRLQGYQQNPLPPTPSDLANAEDGGFDTKVGRKKSLVRPDREKIEPGHRQWYYRNHAAQMEDEGKGNVGLMPSSAYHVYLRVYRFLSHFPCSYRKLPSTPSSAQRQISSCQG